MKNIFLFLVSIIVLSSCEKTVNNVEIPQVDPQLVVQSFLTEHQDSVKVYVSWSAPIYSSFEYNYEDVKDADVYITNNGNKIKLDFKAVNDPYGYRNSSYYIASAAGLVLKAGEKVELDITEPKGNHVTSETIIPVKPIYSISLTSVDSTKEEWSEYGYTYKYNFKLTGNNLENINYYTTVVMGYYTSPYSGIDSVLLQDYSGGTGYYKIAKGDDVFISYPSYNPLDSIKATVYLTDEAYYRYHNSVALFDGGDNPFSEPVIIYSNIENGLGVFCSYNSDFKIFKIKN